jgi:hypothetical protein
MENVDWIQADDCNDCGRLLGNREVAVGHHCADAELTEAGIRNG